MLNYNIQRAHEALADLPPIYEMTADDLADLQEAIVRLQDAEDALRKASEAVRIMRPE